MRYNGTQAGLQRWKGGQMVTEAMNLTGNLAGGAATGMRSRGRADAGLSIVVPVYNESAGLPALHARISEVARRLKETRRLTT